MLIADREQLLQDIRDDLANWTHRFARLADNRLEWKLPYRIVMARKNLTKVRFLIAVSRSKTLEEILDTAFDHFGKNRRSRAFNVFLKDAYIGSVRRRKKPRRRFHYYLAIRIQKKRKNKWDFILKGRVAKFCPFGQVIHKTISIPDYDLKITDGYVGKNGAYPPKD